MTRARAVLRKIYEQDTAQDTPDLSASSVTPSSYASMSTAALEQLVAMGQGNAEIEAELARRKATNQSS